MHPAIPPRAPATLSVIALFGNPHFGTLGYPATPDRDVVAVVMTAEWQAGV